MPSDDTSSNDTKDALHVPGGAKPDGIDSPETTAAAATGAAPAEGELTPSKSKAEQNAAKAVHGQTDPHTHGHAHADHGLAHTMPLPLMFGVLGALLVLTIATVAVTHVDLGAQGNLVVAMVIATIKAGLVVMFFMHLFWDKKFNLVLFLTSVLFLLLFLSMTTTDRGEYQRVVDDYTSSRQPTAK